MDLSAFQTGIGSLDFDTALRAKILGLAERMPPDAREAFCKDLQATHARLDAGFRNDAEDVLAGMSALLTTAEDAVRASQKRARSTDESREADDAFANIESKIQHL